MRFIIGTFLVMVILCSSCRKDEQITNDPNARLSFSNESILFDTIFTSIGSSVKRIKILNNNNKALNISEIKLAGGNSSAFSINLNGQNSYNKTNLIIKGNDSINVFVRVTINPDARNQPFLVQDSIILTTNGNKQTIKLLAYGQNAIFINNSNITTNTYWTNNLPYIINGSVNIKNGSTLTIKPGAKIYFHKDAVMNVEGDLNALGTFEEPIEFCSDRLETIYSNEPGQWKGIYLKAMGSGIIKNAVIKNASVGITSDSLSSTSNPKLILSNNIIKNMQVAAYMGYHSELVAFNNLIYNCGNYLIYAVGGGNYNLKQNTFAGFNPNFPRKTAALFFSDYLSAKAFNKMQLDLTNNIIWGTLNNELDIEKKSTAITQSNFINNLIKTTSTSYNTNGNIINIDPLFASSLAENFMIFDASPAVKKGVNLTGDVYFNQYLNKDLQNKPRIFPSSLGCYEKY